MAHFMYSQIFADFNNKAAFETIRPKRALAPIVFNSSHSGREYPERFIEMSQLDKFSIRQSEDAYVDDLFIHAPNMGAPMLRALFPRAYLDVNREPYELDQKMFEEKLPEHYNINSLRVKSGLGTLARIVAENKPIYSQKLRLADAQMRIENIYRPYHQALQKLLSGSVHQFGIALLIDCHSMPALKPSRFTAAPDIILGDRFGTSCTPAIVDLVETVFSGAGLKVIRNKPYAGGFITHSYGKPNHNVHALQIEISRHLYMNEVTLKPNKDFIAIQKIIDRLISSLLHFNIAALSQGNANAAE